MLFQSFLDYKRIDHRVSSLTLDAYERDLFSLQKWFGCPLEAMTRDDVRRYITDMKEKDLADATLKRRLSTLSQYFEYLINELGHAVRSPVKGFKVPITDREEAYCLRPDERTLLFDYLQSDDSRLGLLDLSFFGLSYYCAFRVSEPLALTFDDIVHHNGHHYARVVGKRQKERIVVIPPKAYEWLVTFIDAARPPIDSPFLFIHPVRRTVMTRKVAWSRLKKAMKNAGLREETVRRSSPHTLRHSRASDLHRAGYSLLMVSRFLNHASVSTTQLYTHTTDSEIDAMALGVD